MTDTKNGNRRYHRIQLNADVTLVTAHDDVIECRCLDFSEDGIDLTPQSPETSFPSIYVTAGDIVTVSIKGILDGPTLKAAIIKNSPRQIGLRFLKPTKN